MSDPTYVKSEIDANPEWKPNQPFDLEAAMRHIEKFPRSGAALVAKEGIRGEFARLQSALDEANENGNRACLEWDAENRSLRAALRILASCEPIATESGAGYITHEVAARIKIAQDVLLQVADGENRHYSGTTRPESTGAREKRVEHSACNSGVSSSTATTIDLVGELLEAAEAFFTRDNDDTESRVRLSEAENRLRSERESLITDSERARTVIEFCYAQLTGIAGCYEEDDNRLNAALQAIADYRAARSHTDTGDKSE